MYNIYIQSILHRSTAHTCKLLETTFQSVKHCPDVSFTKQNGHGTMKILLI